MALPIDKLLGVNPKQPLDLNQKRKRAQSTLLRNCAKMFCSDFSKEQQDFLVRLQGKLELGLFCNLEGEVTTDNKKRCFMQIMIKFWQYEYKKPIEKL